MVVIYLYIAVVMVKQMQESIQTHCIVLPHPIVILLCDLVSSSKALWLSLCSSWHQPAVMLSHQFDIELAHHTD